MNIADEEKKLVDEIIHKKESAFLILYKRYRKLIFNYLKRQLNDMHLAEELTQDVFLDFIEALRDFNFKSSLKTYIFAIARNKAIDVMRKKKIKKILFSAMPDYVVEGLKTIFMDEEIEKKEIEKKINNVMEKLPNDYHLILRLKYIEGEKLTKIAEKFSLGFKATESLLFRARKSFVKIFNSLP